MTNVWSFDVGLSNHDLLKLGVTVHHYVRVVATGRTFAEAQDTAAALAACDGWMPTETLVRI